MILSEARRSEKYEYVSIAAKIVIRLGHTEISRLWLGLRRHEPLFEQILVSAVSECTN